MACISTQLKLCHSRDVLQVYSVLPLQVWECMCQLKLCHGSDVLQAYPELPLQVWEGVCQPGGWWQAAAQRAWP